MKKLLRRWRAWRRRRRVIRWRRKRMRAQAQAKFPEGYGNWPVPHDDSDSKLTNSPELFR